MKLYRVFVSGLMGGIFTALNFNVYALVFSFSSASEGSWNLSTPAVIYIVYVASLSGLIYGLPLGLVVGLLERSAVVGTIVGIAWGALLLAYAAITSTELFAELSPRLLVCFVLTSGIAGLLTSKTSSILYDWSTTKINGEPTRNS